MSLQLCQKNIPAPIPFDIFMFNLEMLCSNNEVINLKEIVETLRINLIKSALKQEKYVINNAALLLNIERTSLTMLIKRYNLIEFVKLGKLRKGEKYQWKQRKKLNKQKRL